MNTTTLKKLLPVILLEVVVITLMTIRFVSSRRERNAEPVPDEQEAYAEVPDAEPADLTQSKSDAYMSSRGSSSIEDYWDSCAPDGVAEEEAKDLHEAERQTVSTTSASTDDLFGASRPPERTYRAQEASVYHESPEEREERHKRRREEAIEMAYAMQQGKEPEEMQPTESEGARITERITIPAGKTGGDVISSLDDGWDGGGISTLGDDTAIPAEDDRPYKCMFLRDEKIRSGGRVSIRLLEDMAVNGTVIPKNSHLMASCSIGDRLSMEVTSIEMGGHIHPLGYEAYDMDGMKGIYCPETGQAAGTARSSGASMIGSTLSSQVGRLASDIVNTGISIVHNASGETTVSVPSGYTFFLVKKKTL